MSVEGDTGVIGGWPANHIHSGPSRLGFPVRVLGRPDLPSHDTRRWQSEPHLRVSLTYLDVIFDYLAEVGIRMFRIASNLAPYATHPDLPQFHGQVAECTAELSALGTKARRLDLRMSLHPPQFVVLNAPDEDIAWASVRELTHQADLLDALQAGPEAKVIIHGGGVYGDRPAAVDRFVARYTTLPESVRRRLVLENDEVSYGVPDILAIHERTGIPLVFDVLHHRVNNPAGLSDQEACRRCLGTWPPGQTPKIHFSSQRTDPVEVNPRNRGGRSSARAEVARPKPGHHADWIDAADFLAFLGELGDEHFDVMLEAKQKDLALLRLREAIAAAGLRDRVW